MWLVTIPNNKESPDTTYHNIQNSITASGLCKTFRFEVPNLVVGTLDTLMALSDDLGKICNQVDVVAKKIERQYVEVSEGTPEPLRVNETTVDSYIKKFQWDFARFQHQGRQLTEIVEQIQAMSGKIDEELKTLVGNYTEKNLLLAAIKRRKQINLSTSDFEDFFDPRSSCKT
jgi:V-type H+-transporting ATPase subunit C